MISTNASMSEMLVETIQQDYITAAARHRLHKSVSVHSLQSKWSVRLQDLVSDVKALFARRQDGHKRFRSEMHVSM